MRLSVFVLVVMVFVSSMIQADEYVINVVESSVTVERRNLIETYFKRIYQPLNIVPQFQYLPSHRGLDLVNSGVLDAEAARFESIALNYQNLVQVTEPIVVVKSVLFCLSDIECEFKDGAAIGVQRGFEGAKLFCEEISASCMFDTSPTILAKLLDAGVLSGLLLTADEASQVLCKLQSSDIYYAHLPQFNRATYHWLHRKHEALIPSLSDAIAKVNETDWFTTLFGNWQVAVSQCGKRYHSI